MKISINQPAYLPWLGYFDRIDYADIHIVLDHVQFEKNSFTNRNKITSNHGPHWITIPVTKGENGSSNINKIRCLQNKKWIKSHLNSISQNYSKAPFFQDYFSSFEKILLKKLDCDNFLVIVEEINRLLLGFLGITTPILYSSHLNIQSKKSELILDLCKSQKASLYLSGINGKDYLKLDSFDKEKIEVLFQSYEHPKYAQKEETFIPFLSILDLLFFHGPNSLNIIRQGRNFIK